MTNCLAMCLTDTEGGIYVVFSYDGTTWTSPADKRLFGSWETKWTPSLVTYNGTLFMALCDGNGAVYVTNYDQYDGLWLDPVYQETDLFGGWETYLDRSPTLYVGPLLMMILMDSSGNVWTSHHHDDNSWSAPIRVFQDWVTYYTPWVIPDSPGYMSVTDTNGGMYVTTYNAQPPSWNVPPGYPNSLFSGWQTYGTRTPSIAEFQSVLYLALTDTNGVLHVASTPDGSWSTNPVPVFGSQWVCYYAPSLAILGNTLWMCFSDAVGGIYMSALSNGSWTQPVPGNSLFSGWRTLNGITPTICDALLDT
jgi:hypothetical protein